MFNFLKHFATDRDETIVSWHGADPIWTDGNYSSLVSEGFQKNVFVYRAVSLVASGIASIPVIVKSLAGNSYVFHDSKEWHCLRPDRVRVIPNKSKTEVESYLYEVDGTKISIEKRDILHLKFFNPLNDWYGLAPMSAAAQAADQYNEMAKHNLRILQNGGRPSGCMILKNIQELTDEQRQQLREDLANCYSGAKNAGKMMILEGGFEWKELGLSPKDLDFAEAKNAIAREIVQAFGVPPILVGIKGNTSFSNYREARAHFWEDTVIPLADFVCTSFAHWFSTRYGSNFRVDFNLDEIPALVGKREMLWSKISNADFLTTDEKREILGFPKLNEGK